MTLGELHDKLEELREAMEGVKREERSIGHGGSEATMMGKRSALESAKSYLEYLRDQELE